MKYRIIKTVLLLVFTILYGCTREKDLMIIGHRGAMGYETENTLAGVEKAIELGADMVEIDVFRCRSGEVVVFHDEKVDRLTDGEGFIEDLTIFQLKFLTVNGGHPIPMLQDVLKLTDKKCKINIELKGDNTADRVNHILKYYIEKKGWQPSDFLISGLKEKELRDFYALNKDIPIGILTMDDPEQALEIAKELNAVSIHAYYKNLHKENVKTLQKEGFKVYAGVVNEPADIDTMKSLGVDGIFTDFPDRIQPGKK